MRSTDVRQGALERLAAWCYHRRRLVVVAWVAILVGAMALSSSFGAEHRADYSMPGSESAAMRQLLSERFPDQKGDPVFLVAHADAGVSDPDVAARLDGVRQHLVHMAHVADVAEPMVSPDGRTMLVAITLDDRAEAVPLGALEALIHVAADANAEGLQVELGGSPVQFAEEGEGGKEDIGLLAALLVLLLVFGSALAAGIPIVLALVGLGVGSAVAMLVGHLVDIPDWGTMLATMIGIGVGIDYALFIVTRYRNALADGHDPEGSVRIAMTTSGRAVLFAGGTVIVSLLGLGITGLEYMWGAAIAMVLGVLGVLAASTTLLPAVLGFAGRTIDRFKVPFVRAHNGRSERWASWSAGVQRRPVLYGVAATAALLALAAPAFSMRFGFPDAGSNPTSTTSRRAFDLTSTAFGPGANGPLIVSVSVDGGDVTQVVPVVAAQVQADPAVAAVIPGAVDGTGSTMLLTVVPVSGPQDAVTESLVRRLRSEVLPTAVAGTEAQAIVGGLTALYLDEAEYEAARLPWFIATVLLLSFVLLLVVFRAPLVALKAAILNLLGIAASYGVIGLAVQGGWLGDLIGIHEPTPVPVFIPILMFALLFGLSMDYEVFLLSRIREEHLKGTPNSLAVREGLARTARVITAAAAIMIVVFGAFILNDQAFAKMAGLGLATAVFLDATIVRMVLVPATMELLGERNWWMPSWLDRRLPRFDVEPAHVHVAAPSAVPAPAPASA